MRKEFTSSLSNFKKYFKKKCRINNTTKKHDYKSNEPNESTEFKCDLCNYSTLSYQNFQKHLETQNHKSKKDTDEEYEVKLNNDEEAVKMLIEDIYRGICTGY